MRLVLYTCDYKTSCNSTRNRVSSILGITEMFPELFNVRNDIFKNRSNPPRKCDFIFVHESSLHGFI